MDQPTNEVQDEMLLAGGTTPVPNKLLDRVMPTLRDTELRVLLVIVRQTRGWQVRPGSPQRKDRDWLTQSQLMRRTGRANGAVSRAVDALVQAALIDVVDRSGRRLGTPSERRRHLGHLYYQLGTGFGDASKRPITERPITERPKSEHAKGHTTKQTQIQKYRADKKVVDNAGENSLLREPFVVRTKGWQRVLKPGGSSTSLPSGVSSGMRAAKPSE